MPSANQPKWIRECRQWIRTVDRRGRPVALWITIGLACLIGVLAGYGAAFFTWLIHTVQHWAVEPLLGPTSDGQIWAIAALAIVPAIGLLIVSWFTRRFAPEAQGHGVPEVIMAVARHDGVIRPRVSLVKILASAFCIGTGGSIGREGPIVQIGSALGSTAGQLTNLSARNIKVLVAAGAAAGISATFHAPIAGVVFASEIILGSFAVESLTPIVIASVLADVVQRRIGEHGTDPAFAQLTYELSTSWSHLPAYFALGLICGLAAVGFNKLVYATEDATSKYLPRWWMRAVLCGLAVGLAGVLYPSVPPQVSGEWENRMQKEAWHPLPPVFGVGYAVVDHTLHLKNEDDEAVEAGERKALLADPEKVAEREEIQRSDKSVRLSRKEMLTQLLWLLPLVFLKPILTSLTLGGGGSGGIFAPSLFLGATTGASFGLICNLLIPGASGSPGIFAIVGMGAVVAGTTHGILSAVLIVYEMTGDYNIILPIMIAAGLASVVARMIDRESIYHKKLSRRGESLARGHDAHRLEHIMVRDVMLREFPWVRQRANLTEIVRVAREHATIEVLPVMNDAGVLVGIIRPEDLHRALDSEIPPHTLFADDISSPPPLAVAPNENLLEALRDFGTRDIETLPVEIRVAGEKRVIGLLLRSDVMRRYREEMLDH